MRIDYISIKNDISVKRNEINAQSKTICNIIDDEHQKTAGIPTMNQIPGIQDKEYKTRNPKQ